MNAFLLILALSGTTACQQPADPLPTSVPDAVMQAPQKDLHNSWDQLVKKHVSNGSVDYSGFVKDKDQLNAYCHELSKNVPAEGASKNEKLAYYINLYNAQTVKLIADNYPLKSIQDLHPTLKVPGVNTVWHRTKFMVGTKEMSLNDVEHEVLRKMDEPRIHFAINCASTSCPPLRNEAYTAEKMETQLTEQAKTFINTPIYNRITTTDLELSQIFNWFTGDFKEGGSVIPFLNRYSTVKIDPNAKIKYVEYDWSLNDTK